MRGSAALIVPALLAIAVLSGCAQRPAPAPSASSAAGASATPSAAPRLDLSGTAEDNLAYFDQVNDALFAANGGADGRTIIDNLVAAGFDKSAMQVTPDKTAINGSVDSILFSVRLGEGCLLGQRGGGRYTGSVAPVLSDGSCLIGLTRRIDW
ncbi:hypothetical protein BH09ACT3_BH09ACT3_13680 [soil metagenome]